LEIEESNAALGAAIQYAAKNLNGGDFINISIENGGWDVYMNQENDTYIPRADSLIDDILDCVSTSNPDAKYK